MRIDTIEFLQYSFDYYAKNWVDIRHFNDGLYSHFDSRVDEIDYLKHHYDVIFEHKMGFGENAFRYFWLLVCSKLAPTSRLLEIGVYKGSILSLWRLISDRLGYDFSIYGVTPLDESGDKYSQYPADNYMLEISRTHDLVGLTRLPRIISGLSTSPISGFEIGFYAPYDLIYIDGGHDYQTVASDLKLADMALSYGGYVVLDDSASFMDVAGFRGHAEVSRAASDFFDNNDGYKHLFLCGHNRIWQKLPI